VSVRVDDRAAGRATFAVALTDPRVVLARTLLGFADLPTVLVGEATNIGSQAYAMPDTGPGRYRITFVCVGDGTSRVTLSAGEAQQVQDLRCTREGARLELDVRTAAPSLLELSIFEVGAPPGSSGYAYRVEELA
jgi:hypothetical protein